MNTLTEMSLGKVAETVFEAVPSSIVQIYALLLARERRAAAVFSIVISVATVAFSSSMMSYDWDTSATLRRKVPAFYGYIPNKALPRAVCFLSMMALSLAHTLLQTFSCALLAVMDIKLLYIYIGADVGIYFLYKIVRKDVYYFPNISGVARLVTAIVERGGAKIMISFTLMFQLRHPCEAGGLMWFSSLLYSMVESLVSVYLYSNNYEDDSKLDTETLRAFILSLYMWLISAVSFVGCMKREYLHTFYNADTANENERKRFAGLREDQDDLKSKAFNQHPDLYAGWGDDLVKSWTLKNWDRWEEEKPAWFTEKWISQVLNHFIPYDWRVKYKKTQVALTREGTV